MAAIESEPIPLNFRFLSSQHNSLKANSFVVCERLKTFRSAKASFATVVLCEIFVSHIDRIVRHHHHHHRRAELLRLIKSGHRKMWTNGISLAQRRIALRCKHSLPIKLSQASYVELDTGRGFVAGWTGSKLCCCESQEKVKSERDDFNDFVSTLSLSLSLP